MAEGGVMDGKHNVPLGQERLWAALASEGIAVRRLNLCRGNDPLPGDQHSRYRWVRLLLAAVLFLCGRQGMLVAQEGALPRAPRVMARREVKLDGVNFQVRVIAVQPGKVAKGYPGGGNPEGLPVCHAPDSRLDLLAQDGAVLSSYSLGDTQYLYLEDEHRWIAVGERPVLAVFTTPWHEPVIVFSQACGGDNSSLTFFKIAREGRSFLLKRITIGDGADSACGTDLVVRWNRPRYRQEVIVEQVVPGYGAFIDVYMDASEDMGDRCVLTEWPLMERFEMGEPGFDEMARLIQNTRRRESRPGR